MQTRDPQKPAIEQPRRQATEPPGQEEQEQDDARGAQTEPRPDEREPDDAEPHEHPDEERAAHPLGAAGR